MQKILLVVVYLRKCNGMPEMGGITKGG